MTQFFAANIAQWIGALNHYERPKEPLSAEPTWVAVLAVKRDRKGIRVNQGAVVA